MIVFQERLQGQFVELSGHGAFLGLEHAAAAVSYGAQDYKDPFVKWNQRMFRVGSAPVPYLLRMSSFQLKNADDRSKTCAQLSGSCGRTV